MSSAACTTKPAGAGSNSPTAEQLALAYRHLARPGWPSTLESALGHRVYGVAVRALARKLGRRSWAEAHASQRPHSLPVAAVPPTPSEPPANARAPRTPSGHAARPGPVGNLPQPLGYWPAQYARPGAGWVDRKRLAANDHDD